MTLPTGPISFLNIQNEFGGTAPISLNEYYAGAPTTSTYVYGTLPNLGYGTGVKYNGSIDLGSFRGQTNWTITTSTGGVTFDFRAWAIGRGWNQSSSLTVYISTGTVIMNGATTGSFWISGTYPGGLTINNYGTILGRGGSGAIGSSGGVGAGFGGYVGMHFSSPGASVITVKNYGKIFGGGGGGGGSTTNIGGTGGIVYCGGGGGAGGGSGGSGYGNNRTGTWSGGAGGGYEASGSNAGLGSALNGNSYMTSARGAGGYGGGGGGSLYTNQNGNYWYGAGGGGGGSGITNTSGGSGGTYTTWPGPSSPSTVYYAAPYGGAGSGTPGVGGNAGGTDSGNRYGAAAGGGGWGASGGTGGTGTSAGTGGGAGGNSVYKGGGTAISVTNYSAGITYGQIG